MAVSVDVHNPQVLVKLVTKRYGAIPFSALRPALRGFNVRRRMGEACGAWTMMLSPTRPPVGPPANLADFAGGSIGWQDVVEPGDYVEFHVWTPPRKDEMPLMRGLVDTVGETFAIGDGKPVRVVQVAGRDFGKMALAAKTYYLGDNPLQIEVFSRWLDGFDAITAAGIKKGGQYAQEPEEPVAQATEESLSLVKPAEVMKVIFDKFYIPQYRTWSTTFISDAQVPEPKLDIVTDDSEDLLAAVNPAYSPQNWEPYADVWSLFRSYQHHPWRELFFDDDETGPVLRYRPTPWLDVSGNNIQAADGASGNGGVATSVKKWLVPRSHRITWSLFRSDEQVFNFFITIPAQFGSLAAMAKSIGRPGEGIYAEPPFQSNPFLVGLEDATGDESATGRGSRFSESAFQRHGLRIMEKVTPYISMDPNTKENRFKQVFAGLQEQGVDLNLRLKRAYDHGALLEFGSMELKGDERVHIGDYVQHEDGSAYYAEGVAHNVVTTESPVFTTTLEVTRGRGHILRTTGQQ